MALLTAIHPERLHDVWPWVREGLDKVKKKAGGDWIPEDVFTALRNGTYTLFLIGQQEGFTVLGRQQQPSGPVLFIWILHGTDVFHYRQEFTDELRQIAAAMGARKIRYNSPRSAWIRLGFTPVETIYEMEL